MRLVLSSLIVMAGFLSGQAAAAPEQAPHADIRDSGFVYCVSGQVNTFNPQKTSSGLIVDTLAAQLYDRLLDVDPYTYRLVPELAESWEVLDNGATYRFHLRRDVQFQKTAWFTGYRKYKPPFCSSSEVSYLKFPHSFTAQAPILTAGPA